MILIVDDRKENLFSLKSTLQLHGFDVDTAESGEECLRKVLKVSYALIILDVQMPGMDGFEVAEALSGINRARYTPILFLSAVNVHKRFITRGFESGAIDYITKPVDPDILLLRVKTFYRLYEQTTALSEARQRLQQEVEVRRDAERALSQTVRELHSTLEAIPQIAFTARGDGTLDYVNRQWMDYAEGPYTFPSVRTGDRPLEQIWNEAVASGQPVTAEVYIRHRDSGHAYCHLLRALPLSEDGTTTKWVGTLTNIHDQKTANERLETEVAEFASVASHDLKEPLRKIHLFSSIIQEKYSEQSEAIAPFLNKIMTASDRMTQLINDVLQLSRTSGPGDFEDTDLNEILRTVQNDLEITIREKEALIHLPQPLPVVRAVPPLIRQLFQNLLSNSLKFQQPGRRPEITITAAREASVWRIEFCDNGIGFEDAHNERIFTLFQRLNDREAYEGTGIGLAIVRKIVQRHGGTVSARSTPGQGATFIIHLPIQPAT